MASLYSPFYNYERASQYPYVDTVSVGKEDRVNFIYQFVKECKSTFFSITNNYITGAHTTFPNYGEFQNTFVIRTYGFDISISPWQNLPKLFYRPQYIVHNRLEKTNNCYVLILFHEAVYPIRVSIYEIYNPGNIIQISAQDSNMQWFTLWEGLPQIVPPISRLFSPPLQSCNFKTKTLKLEFKNSKWDYYAIIDAVMLVGTSKLILPKNSNKSLTDLLKKINCTYPHQEDIHNLTADYKNAHLDIDRLQKYFSEYCIIDKSNIGKSYVQPIRQRYSQRLLLRNYSKNTKPMKLPSDKSKKISRCILSTLPNDVLFQILKNLDLMSLCRMSQVNKSFHSLIQDPLLYTRLNMRNICDVNTTYIKNIFCYFTPKCKYLQQLDLTFSNFRVSDFKTFLDNCGRHLTHIRLSKCLRVNNNVLLKITKICNNLKKLDLRFCYGIDNIGFSYLENLESLEFLNLSYTHIKARPLSKILQKNQRVCELNLEAVNLGANAMKLKNCRNLERIDLAFAKNVSSQSISALADCKNLRMVNLQIDGMIPEDSLHRLVSSCQRLEEVHLTGFVITDRNLKSLTRCKNLKRLSFYFANFVTSDKYSVIFEQCPKLQSLCLVCCRISSRLIHHWEERYPHVSVLVT